MFLGTYTPKLDDKGRLIFPAKFRDVLAEGLVMTRGQEHCIAVYPISEFHQKLSEARRAPTTDQRTRDYLRVLLSGAEDVVPDKQGRITIPPSLRKYAGLERETAVIGALDRLEIWSLPAWETYLEQKEEDFAQTAEEVVPGLF
ncbi:division/cell wall cluster transcriptional repressor MraZ [Brachybacterium sp. DNPG3]